ncbi:MAG: TatD family hydrolase [Deltaproteobacteria bacterium]|nr:TatD family hydrolase [Deltaproteobacteria bacterium]
MLIDSHCHLSELTDEEAAAQVGEAYTNGVTTLVAIGAGYGFKSNTRTLEISQKFTNVYCALAVHPHDASQVDDQCLSDIKNLVLSHDRVCAVGETGLDYHYMHSPKEVQQAVFGSFIDLALSVKKPLVVHDRECGDDCVNILKNGGAERVGGVAHCFSGSIQTAFKYLDLGFYISFSGVVTFKKADAMREVVKAVPLDRILIETDAPFLAPEPFRGKKNRPAYVRYTAQKIAEVRGGTFEEIAKTTTGNTMRLFEI